jgi:hypothetical protein
MSDDKRKELAKLIGAKMSGGSQPIEARFAESARAARAIRVSETGAESVYHA